MTANNIKYFLSSPSLDVPWIFLFERHTLEHSWWKPGLSSKRSIFDIYAARKCLMEKKHYLFWQTEPEVKAQSKRN